MSRIAGILGIKINYIENYEWAEYIDMLKNSEIDIISNISRSKTREEVILFSNPVMEFTPSFACRKDENITSFDDLKSRKLAILKGVWFEDFIKNNFPGIKTVSVNTESEAYKLISNGTVDATIAYLLSAEYYIKFNRIADIHITSPVNELDGGKDLNHIGIRKDWPLLASSIDKALEYILKRKENRLSAEWIEAHVLNKSKNVILTENEKDITEIFRRSLKNYSYEKENKIAFTETEAEYLKRKKVIKMCVDPNWMPVEGIDSNGSYTGLGANIISLISKRTGINFELIPTKTWSETEKNAIERKCDIISMISITEERKKYLDFTSEYVSLPLVIATNEKELFIPNLTALSGKKVAIVKDTAYQEFFSKRYPQIDLVSVNTPLEGLNSVERGSIFGFIGPLPTIAYSINFYGFHNLKVGGKFDLNWKLSVGTRNDEPVLHGVMQKAVSTLTDAEKLNEYNMWYSVDLLKKTDHRIVWQIILVSTVLISIILLWNYSLLKSRKKAKIALANLKTAQIKLEEQNIQLEKLAVTDKLTGLYNRIRLDEVLENEVEKSRRYGTPLALILMDMDLFKSVNDTFGHQTGDKLLVHIAEILKKRNRKTDTVGRWGGEEFIVICPMSDREAVTLHAEKIRISIENNPLKETGIKTVSCGTAVFQKNDSASTLTSRADKALYMAKNNGRNRVEFME